MDPCVRPTVLVPLPSDDAKSQNKIQVERKGEAKREESKRGERELLSRRHLNIAYELRVTRSLPRKMRKCLRCPRPFDLVILDHITHIILKFHILTVYETLRYTRRFVPSLLKVRDQGECRVWGGGGAALNTHKRRRWYLTRRLGFLRLYCCAQYSARAWT